MVSMGRKSWLPCPNSEDIVLQRVLQNWECMSCNSNGMECHNAIVPKTFDAPSILSICIQFNVEAPYI
jgi:hypothetical protein